MRKNILHIIFIFLFIACEKPVDWEQKNSFTPKLVVEGMLTDHPDLNYVKLSFPVTDPNGEVRRVSDATVIITDGEDYAILNEDSSEVGLYKPDSGKKGIVNKAYQLYIKVNQYEFTAYTYMVPGSKLREFRYTRDTEKNNYYYLNPFESITPAMTEYRITYPEPEGRKTQTSIVYYYKLGSVDVTQFFEPAQETISFPANAQIIRTKYSLNPDYERYLRSLLLETEWKGGWFDVLPGNLHTNLSDGAVGYFSACSVERDTVYFN